MGGRSGVGTSSISAFFPTNFFRPKLSFSQSASSGRFETSALGGSSKSPRSSQKRYMAVAAPSESATMTIGQCLRAASSMLSTVPGPPCTTTCTIGIFLCVA